MNSDPTTTSVIIRHNFETAHRLPQLGGKCTSLHGHSWWCEVTVTGPLDRQGVVVDFASLKSGMRSWIDTHLDHGTMLGVCDPLVAPLRADGTKLLVFDPPDAPTGYTAGLAWPTVENVAELLRRVAADVVLAGDHDGIRVTRVRVTETAVNTAEVWCPA